MAAYSPSVLLIDDDTSIMRYLRQNFHENTSVGVLTATRLEDAREIIDSADVHLDAVVSDLLFDQPSSTDPDHGLRDGIDALAYAKRRRPDADRYVLSFWVTEENRRLDADNRQIDVKRWMPKMFYDPGEEEKTIWAQIERDLIERHLRAEGEDDLNREPPDNLSVEDTMLETMRKLKFPMRTYLQNLESDDFVLVKPIEVICTQDEEGLIVAMPRKIGLMEEGVGESVDFALSDLGRIILDEKKVGVGGVPVDKLLGLAKQVRDKLDEYVVAVPEESRAS